MIANTPEAWSAQAEIEDPYEAVRWSEGGQRERHEAVIAALDPRSNETLLDYGCGLGALVYLMPDDVDYTGYDWAEGMVARARREWPMEEFTNEEPQKSFDLTAVVGTFNLSASPDGVHEAFETIRRLWNHTNRALAASLYNGLDLDCLNYRAEVVAVFADAVAKRWTLRRHRDNDLLLLLER